MGNENLGSADHAQEPSLQNTDRVDGGSNPQLDANPGVDERQSFNQGVENADGDDQRDDDQMVRDQLARDENQQIDPAAERGGGRMFTGQDPGSETMIGTTAHGTSGQDDTMGNFGAGTDGSVDSDMQQGGLGSGGQGADGTMDDQGEEGRDA